MNKILLLFALLITGVMGYSQQELQYTNFMFSDMAFNPGYAGSNDAIVVTALARQQWMGFTSTYGGDKGAPQDIYLTLESNVNPLHGGLGLTIIKDKIGFEDNIGLRLAYAFRLNLGPGKLGIGLQGGVINKKVDFSGFTPTDPTDPLLLSKNVETSMSFDMAFGAFYKVEDVFYAGISSTQLTQSVADFASGIATPTYKRHYFIHGGYYYQLPMNPNIVINPNILVKTDFVSAQYDINVLGWYNNAIYAGVTYRAIDAVAILAGVAIPKVAGLMGGIAYDVTTSAIGRKGSDNKVRSFGSTEIYFKYKFNIIIKIEPQRHKTVLFL